MEDEELNELKTELAVFIEKVSSWMETTNSYRKTLCDKIDKIADKVIELPCKERKGWYQSLNRQMNFMWLVLGIIVTALLISGVHRIYAK